MKEFKTFNYNISFIFKKFFIIILLTFLKSNNIFINSFITLPFSYINKKTNNSSPQEKSPKEYFESFINNSVFSTIKIKNKNINFHVSTERHTIYISQKTLNSNLKEKEINNTNLFSLEYIGISEALLTNESFQFLLNNTKKIDVDKISYFIVKKFYNNPNNFSKISSLVSENEEIGFSFYKGNPYEKVEVGDDDDVEDFYSDIFDFDDDKGEVKNKSEDKNKLIKNGGYEIEENTNIIKQLKKLDLISSYTFLIKYNNKNNEKGEIIIGGLPHEYDPKHYSEDYFIFDYVPRGDQPPYNWHFFFDKITYGNNSVADHNNLTYYRNVAFSLDSGFIIASFIFKNYFL